MFARCSLALLLLGACTTESPTPSAPAPATSSGGGASAGAPSSAAPSSASAMKTIADDLVGGPAVEVPFILWGGEAATFHANGGLKTAKGSIFGNLGLNIHLVPGDNFAGSDGQVERYLARRTSFLRGTFRMIALQGEKLSARPETTPYFLVQMTRSKGDHLVVRGGVKDIKGLRGKRIALQEGGPHVGMLDDILRTAGLTWKDIQLISVPDITGPNGPAARFRADSLVDGCFAVTPDMIGLTAGLGQVGTGAEGTVKGARVLDSTAFRPHSIIDFYAVSRNFYETRRDWAEKFVAGYLKGVEEVVAMKAAKTPAYHHLLNMMVAIYTPSVLPNATEADGLVSDCEFVGLPGNKAFFADPTYPHGFAVFEGRSVKLAQTLGLATKPFRLLSSPVNWGSATLLGMLQHTEAKGSARFNAEATRNEIERMQQAGGLDTSTVYSFTVHFPPNQTTFDTARYAADFDRALQVGTEYRGAALVVRGHADPTLTLKALVQAGQRKGVLTATGQGAERRYSLRGRPLELSRTKELTDLIRSGAFDGDPGNNPRDVMQQALNLSRERAGVVREALIAYAREKKVRVDETQLQPQGVGIAEPFVAVPRSPAEAESNMRVEFRIVGISAEATNPADFEY